MTVDDNMTRLENLEDGQKRIENRLGKVENRLTNIETAQYQTNKSLSNLESGQKEILRAIRNQNPQSPRVSGVAVTPSRSGQARRRGA